MQKTNQIENTNVLLNADEHLGLDFAVGVGVELQLVLAVLLLLFGDTVAFPHGEAAALTLSELALALRHDLS